MRKIALLLDVDNVKISGNAFEELYAKLRESGDVAYCKFYGYNDRKHIYLSEVISKYGYETAPFMRFKKRFSQLDNRIIVDAVKLNYTKPEINTYCIVAGDGDLVPLLVELKSSGRTLVDINSDYQEINGYMFDEHVVLQTMGIAAQVYAPKTVRGEKPKLAPKPIVTPKVEDSAPAYTNVDNTLSQILRNITSRYNELDFSDDSDMPKKLKLIKDIEDLIASENAKGEGVYSKNADVRQIFGDLLDVVDDMKSAI